MQKQPEWRYQWSKFKDDNLFLFKEWIYPYTLQDFTDKTVCDCGCGHGQHLIFISSYCKKAVGIDLNTADIARENVKNCKNVEIIEADIENLNIEEKFDIVYCIGVIHHTDNPNKAFVNIKNLVKPGGILIIWVYSWEGNFFTRTILEFLRKLIFSKIHRDYLLFISKIITLMLYIPVYTLYKLPLKFLPFYEYFSNFRKLSFKRNLLNVFDKLNAPQTKFIKKSLIQQWFNTKEFKNICIRHHKGISYHASGIKK
ncbi:MAG: class I SAM-dependent methyltransferase [Elusimicrobiota bacterium]|nr:class I SAM-dependent methyltransferase [Endomicrobiia bacterium]MDW8055344.1 class I SAM-dependent methyltransferase [Elusimicrobiota bacterium]MDW8166447.1 class I SAM-dependent methyltransferase [Elusimicrobiota bacterium]